MITSELISFIRKQIQNNISKDLIISKLLNVGWRIEDINEGFLNVDMYHEPIEGNNIFELKKEIPRKEIPKVETLKIEIPKQEIEEVDSPKIETPPIETVKTEDPKVEIPQKEIPKVWVPINVPVKEKTTISNVDFGVISNTTKMEVQDLELELESGKEELIPILKSKKEEFNPFDSMHKENLVKPTSFIEPIIPVVSAKPIIPPTPIDNSTRIPLKDLSKVAMLSSYKSDLLSIDNKTKEIKEKIIKKKGGKKTKWIIFLLLLIIVVGLLAWVFASGYINIKKDPKILLLNNSKVLSSLKSYKTETNIEISSPSMSNISSGILKGEVVSNPNKDSISVNTLGIVNQNEQNSFSDNFMTIKSSLLSEDYITTDIKTNGSDLFISIPDLSSIMKENTPKASVVKINEQQFDLVTSLFPEKIVTELKKINIYKVLSNGIISYINDDTLSIYDEFINNVEVTEKGQENIKGIDTYHYSINADRQLAKKLLKKICDDFTLNLSNDDKNKLDQILGGITINSFDVWVGKGDNNIYQYNVVVDIPLSKIIGFEDKGIGNSVVSINWKTTYYDFNVSNNISMPTGFISANDFVDNIKKIKIKNDISFFKQLATNLFDIEKTYGVNSNLSGSCMNPTSGSLFSPIGHIKSADNYIGSISLFLNKILERTNENGFCYSTPKAWSFTIPISDNYDLASIPVGGYTSFFCVDSTDYKEEITTPPTGVTCLSPISLSTDLPRVEN